MPAKSANLSLADALDIAIQRRHGIIKPDYNVLWELTGGRIPSGTYDDFERFRDLDNLHDLLSVEDALEDVAKLFDFMRGFYGMYVYFGGDEVFGEVRAAVEQEITRNRDGLSKYDFGLILHRQLGYVIDDTHFYIAFGRLGVGTAFYTANIPFDKTQNGFKHRESGLYVSSIKDNDIDYVLRLTIDENGEFFYTPVVYKFNPQGAGASVEPLTVIFEDGSSQLLWLQRHNPARREFKAPSLEYIDGVPVVTVMSMGFPDAHTEGSQQARNFLSFADELKDEPVVIVDVRSNGGGNGVLPMQWLHRLTGELVPSNSVWLWAQSFEDLHEMFAAESPFTNPSYVNLEDRMLYMRLEAFGEFYTIFSNHPDRIVPNEQLIIVLTDRFSGSAAEVFADLTLNMENALIIGTNTYGSLRADYVATWALPNSGLPFGFGRGVIVWPEGLFTESIGLAPDIWVHGDPLPATLALLRNAGFGN
jgi:hypothetical protein